MTEYLDLLNYAPLCFYCRTITRLQSIYGLLPVAYFPDFPLFPLYWALFFAPLRTPSIAP